MELAIWSVPGERTVFKVSAAGTDTMASMTTTIHALKREPERVELGSYMADLLKFSIILLFSAALAMIQVCAIVQWSELSRPA